MTTLRSGSNNTPCRIVSESYKYLNVISEGVYGVVHRALEYKSQEIVALKKIKVHKTKSGFPQSSFREINILNRLQHDNVVRIREIVVDEHFVDVFMVMDYAANDLQSIMVQMNKKQPSECKRKWRWPLSQCKCLMHQLLSGVQYLHSMFILHRDLKTSNLLLSSDGTLKICDFGMAREYSIPIGQYTNYVVTLWYRAPELLLAANEYGPPVDLWSVGCIFAELLCGEVLFPGDGEFAQISKIFDLLGTPTESVVREWPHWKMFPWPIMKRKVAKRFPIKKESEVNGIEEEKGSADENGQQPVFTQQTVVLLEQFLKYDPKERITATKALRHELFRIEAPDMTKKEDMPLFDEHHTTRKEKRPDDVGDLNMTNDNEDAVSC